MLLTVSLPHTVHTLPLVSTRPLVRVASILTYPMEWRKHSCSNLVDVKDSFLWRGPSASRSKPTTALSRDPRSELLYGHLHCKGWTFELWLPLKSILDDCQVTPGGDTLQLYVAYIQIHSNTLLTLKATSFNASFPQKRVDPQVSLFSVRPIDGRDIGLTLHPLASSYDRALSRVEMYLYVHLPAGRDFNSGRAGLVSGANTAMDLLYASSTTCCTVEAWHATVPVGGEQRVNVSISLEGEGVFTTTTTTTMFYLGIDIGPTQWDVPIQWSVPVVVQMATSLSSGVVSRQNFTYG